MTNRNIRILVTFIYVLILFVARYGLNLFNDSTTMLLLVIGLFLLFIMSKRESRKN